MQDVAWRKIAIAQWREIADILAMSIGHCAKLCNLSSHGHGPCTKSKSKIKYSFRRVEESKSQYLTACLSLSSLSESCLQVDTTQCLSKPSSLVSCQCLKPSHQFMNLPTFIRKIWSCSWLHLVCNVAFHLEIYSSQSSWQVTTQLTYDYDLQPPTTDLLLA